MTRKLKNRLHVLEAEIIIIKKKSNIGLMSLAQRMYFYRMCSKWLSLCLSQWKIIIIVMGCIYFESPCVYALIQTFFAYWPTKIRKKFIYIYIYIWGLDEKLTGSRKYSHWIWPNKIFFNMVPLAVHTLLKSVLQCLNPIGQKISSSQRWHHHINFSTHPCKFGNLNITIKSRKLSKLMKPTLDVECNYYISVYIYIYIYI